MGSTDDMRRAIPPPESEWVPREYRSLLGDHPAAGRADATGAPTFDGRRSFEHFLHKAAAKPGQPLVESLIEVGQFLVIQAEQMQDRGVEIGNVARIVNGFEAEFV